MTEEFVPDDNKSECPNDESAAVSEQEIVCVTVTGSHPTSLSQTF